MLDSAVIYTRLNTDLANQPGHNLNNKDRSYLQPGSQVGTTEPALYASRGYLCEKELYYIGKHQSVSHPSDAKVLGRKSWQN